MKLAYEMLLGKAEECEEEGEELLTSQTSLNFIDLADAIYEGLGDKEWAKRLYERAEEKAGEEPDEEAYSSYYFSSFAESVRNNLGDEKWAKLLEQKAKELEDDE